MQCRAGEVKYFGNQLISPREMHAKCAGKVNRNACEFNKSRNKQGVILHIFTNVQQTLNVGNSDADITKNSTRFKRLEFQSAKYIMHFLTLKFYN